MGWKWRGSPPPEEWKRERRVSEVMDTNPDRGGNGRGEGAKECDTRRALRWCRERERGERRRPDIADLAVYHLRAATEVGRPLLSALVATGHRSRGRGPRPNPGHCSHRFNRYSLSALGSFPKTPGWVSSPDAPIPGSSCALPLPHLTLPLSPPLFPRWGRRRKTLG